MVSPLNELIIGLSKEAALLESASTFSLHHAAITRVDPFSLLIKSPFGQSLTLRASSQNLIDKWFAILSRAAVENDDDDDVDSTAGNSDAVMSDVGSSLPRTRSLLSSSCDVQPEVLGRQRLPTKISTFAPDLILPSTVGGVRNRVHTVANPHDGFFAEMRDRTLSEIRVRATSLLEESTFSNLLGELRERAPSLFPSGAEEEDEEKPRPVGITSNSLHFLAFASILVIVFTLLASLFLFVVQRILRMTWTRLFFTVVFVGALVVAFTSFFWAFVVWRSQGRILIRLSRAEMKQLKIREGVVVDVAGNAFPHLLLARFVFINSRPITNHNEIAEWIHAQEEEFLLCELESEHRLELDRLKAMYYRILGLAASGVVLLVGLPLWLVVK